MWTSPKDVVSNESVERMINLAHKDNHLFCSWINNVFEWTGWIDSLVKTATFEWTWMNQHFWTNHWMWMIHWLAHKDSYVYFGSWMTCSWVLNEWLNDSLVKTVTIKSVNESAFLNESLEWITQWLTNTVTCFVLEWASDFEQFGGGNDLSNHLTVIYVTCMYTHY